MKRLFVCAVALGLFATVPAFAARGDDHQGDKHNTATQDTKAHGASGGAHQNGPAGAMMGGGHAGSGGGNANATTTVKSFSTGAATGGGHMGNGGGNSHGTMSGNSFLGITTGGTHTRTRVVNPQGAMSGNGSSAGTSFNMNSGHKSMRRTNSAPANTVFGNTAGRNPSINSLRLNVQSSRHFRHGNYNAPQGYQARHWSYGGRLPRSYFVRDYWITDFLMFGLFAPPPDLIWVRVGNDALLVDRYSGDIVQVDYDVFY
jgi:Ni/Co efflux regulator RcnB